MIDQSLPRVTYIMQMAGMVDFSMVGAETMRKAQNRGTFVHRICQHSDMEDLDRSLVDDEMLKYVDAWNKYLADTGYEVEETEMPVVSTKWGYRGTLDRILKIKMVKKDYLDLIDLKATASLGPAVEVQLAAYKLAYTEMTRKTIRKMTAVQLKPDGTYSTLPCKDKTAEYTFLSALQLYKWRKKHNLIKGD